MAVELKPGDRVGIIAGGGFLPLHVARTLRSHGHDPFVLIVEGEPATDAGLSDFPNASLPVEKFARFIPALRRERVSHVVMAGAITRRPKWSAVEWSWPLMKMLAAAVPALARGDDALLKAIIAQFDRHGLKVVGPHEVVPDLMAQSGPMTATKPDRAGQRDIDAAREAALAIGKLDIGQGAVAVGGRAIALEGIEGTDGLLERVRELRGHGRLAGRTGGVLVKLSKPGQELRADLPGIGPRTVDDAHAAGLKGIGVEAGRTFLLDYDATVRRADELGLFIVGLDGGEGT